jgi:cold shock CspA family protein
MNPEVAGFVETDEGEEVYVHRNAAVGGGFDRLKVGDRVRYVIDQEEGEKGVQAIPLIRAP